MKMSKKIKSIISMVAEKEDSSLIAFNGDTPLSDKELNELLPKSKKKVDSRRRSPEDQPVV